MSVDTGLSTQPPLGLATASVNLRTAEAASETATKRATLGRAGASHGRRAANESLAGSELHQGAELMQRRQFIARLSREKRRADRSKAPLSLAVFRVQADTDRMGEFVDLVLGSARDTDCVGWIAENEVAVLLPETGSAGMQTFVDKVRQRASGYASATACATYPDHLFEDVVRGAPTSNDTQPLFLDDEHQPSRGTYVLKRAIDVVGASVALALFSPLMIATAVAVKLSSPGPVVFKQKRVGRKGVPFVFYKFRSMRTDGDDAIHRAYVEKLINGQHDGEHKDGQPYYKIKADPRVTRVGAVIRKTSLDELPQLFNVLKGDMSLVGPRPPLPYEAKAYQSWHLRRVLEMKPGITGLWQVEGRSRVTFDEMVRMDLRYVRGCSLMLDLRILLKTVRVLVWDKGAV